MRRVRTKFMPSSSFRMPRAVRDSSRFLSVLVLLLTRGVPPSLFGAGAGFCLGRENEEVVVPVVSPAARRVPCTDDLSILVNDLVGGVAARCADEGGLLLVLLLLLLPLASSDAREGTPDGIWIFNRD